jgi:hypothetical protein
MPGGMPGIHVFRRVAILAEGPNWDNSNDFNIPFLVPRRAAFWPNEPRSKSRMISVVACSALRELV